jgi:hypothetical protein
MLLWNLNHPIPFKDVVEVQGPPTKIMEVQTRSKSQHVQSDPTTTQSYQGNQVANHPKTLFSSQNSWALKMSKNNLSLTLIYQPEDSSFISKNIGKVYADSS